MKPIVTWLHLSDIHFGHDHGGGLADRQLVLGRLEQDIDGLIRAGVPSPNLILVSGDIAFSGAARRADEYEAAATWIARLRERLALKASDVFTVPGNHDVCRVSSQVGNYTTFTLVGQLRGAPHFTLDAALADSEARGHLESRFRAYADFARDNTASCEILKYRVTRPLEGGSRSLHVVGLNTAVLANDDDDAKRLRVATSQRDVLPNSLAAGDVVVALGHHPPTNEWFGDSANDLLQTLLQRAHILLTGHVHEQNGAYIATLGGDSAILISAGSCHEGVGLDGHAYNVGSLFVNGEGFTCLRVWPRRWSRRRQRFQMDVDNLEDNVRTHPFQDLPLAKVPKSTSTTPTPQSVQVTLLPTEEVDVDDAKQRIVPIYRDAGTEAAWHQELEAYLPLGTLPSRMLYSGPALAAYWLGMMRSNKVYESLQQAFTGVLPDLVARVRSQLASHNAATLSIVDLGVGDGDKGHDLAIELGKGATSLRFVAVDISYEMLLEAIRGKNRPLRNLHRDVPGNLVAINASFAELHLFDHLLGDGARIFLLLGNTIGNETNDLSTLRELERLMNPNDILVVELQLLEDPPTAPEKIAEAHRASPAFYFGPFTAVGCSPKRLSLGVKGQFNDYGQLLDFVVTVQHRIEVLHPVFKNKRLVVSQGDVRVFQIRKYRERALPEFFLAAGLDPIDILPTTVIQGRRYAYVVARSQRQSA